MVNKSGGVNLNLSLLVLNLLNSILSSAFKKGPISDFFVPVTSTSLLVNLQNGGRLVQFSGNVLVIVLRDRFSFERHLRHTRSGTTPKLLQMTHVFVGCHSWGHRVWKLLQVCLLRALWKSLYVAIVWTGRFWLLWFAIRILHVQLLLLAIVILNILHRLLILLLLLSWN